MSDDEEGVGQRLAGGYGQTRLVEKRNASFFLEEHETYRKRIESMDSYVTMAHAVSGELRGIGRLLDIGNGGVFAYDLSMISEVVGLDLFVDRIPASEEFPTNVTMVRGNALEIPDSIGEFDGVLMMMLVHHLVGADVAGCYRNAERALHEAHRVLRPGGKMILMESCVPRWFYQIERNLFRISSWVISNTIKHPPAFQYTREGLTTLLQSSGFKEVRSQRIPLGRFVLQYGVKVPSILTPIFPVLFVGFKQ